MLMEGLGIFPSLGDRIIEQREELKVEVERRGGPSLWRDLKTT